MAIPGFVLRSHCGLAKEGLAFLVDTVNDLQKPMIPREGGLIKFDLASSLSREPSVILQLLQ